MIGGSDINGHCQAVVFREFFRCRALRPRRAWGEIYSVL